MFIDRRREDQSLTTSICLADRHSFQKFVINYARALRIPTSSLRKIGERSWIILGHRVNNAGCTCQITPKIGIYLSSPYPLLI